MDSFYKIKVTHPSDNSGYRHHQCPDCKEFFKVKPGTGLSTQDIHCPYCPSKGRASHFLTDEMKEYGNAMLKRNLKIVDRWRLKMEKGFHHSRGPFRSTVKTSCSETPDPILRMRQEKLETFHTCYDCGLDFAIYGVFSRCPDCGGINAFGVFKDTVLQRFQILAASIPDPVQANTAIVDALIGSVGAFDALGKELRKRHPAFFPEKPKNLFQNFRELEKSLKTDLGLDLSANCTDIEHTRRMFQVRHIYDHNLGVVDDEFIAKSTQHHILKGRKYPLTKEEVLRFMEQLVDVVHIIETALASKSQAEE